MQDFQTLMQRTIEADKQLLAAMYADLIGYDPFEDDESADVEDVRETLQEYIAELCIADSK